MATFTITTPVNIDTLSGKTGGDVYNINGGYLTIDQDSRVGLNQTTSTTLGNIALSATLGGTCEINSTLVRIIPYTSGSGNVPSWNTTISQGSASGLIIGVYSSLDVASTDTGAAMPASGFIKIKQWNSNPYFSGLLTGITASATGSDTQGWIELVGTESSTCTVNRLNLFKVRGDYFQLGTTDGNRATTYQIPSSGMLQYHAGVEVETGIGTGIYEFYNCIGTLSALSTVLSTDELRGKKCWISNTGLLRFGSDGTNSSGGYIPPAGRKVRIANIFMHNCTVALKTANALPNATMATRYEFSTGGGGVIDIDKCSTSWYLNFGQPYSVNLSNIGVCTAMIISEVATPLILNNVNVGQEASNTQTSLTLSLCFSGGTVTNCDFLRIAQAGTGTYVAVFSDLSGFTFNNNKFSSGTKAGTANTGAISATRVVNSTFNNTILGGSGRFLKSACVNLNVNDTVYYDTPVGNTPATNGFYMFDMSTSCSNITYSGVSFGGLYLNQPYNGLLQIGQAGCTNIKLRNIGTYENPLSLGRPRVDDMSWDRVTTNATVTEVGHPFTVSDTIYVVISSNTSAIVVGAKTITAVTSDTFTFVCLNAGSASGTVSYFGTKCANVFILGTSCAADTVKIQRVYAPHTRSNLYTADNSAKNITMENLFSDYLNAPLISMLNGYSKGVSGTPPLSAQTSVYGTHWFNGYVCDVANNTINQSYSRTTTVCTITSVGHSLRTGMLITLDPINAPTTFTAAQYSVTCLTSSTFNITVANAGAASGTVSYRVANGRIGLVMNEASPDTLDRYTIDSGNPVFTSAGGLYMPTIGDQITFITPNYLLGQGSTFPPFEPIIGGSTLTRYHITYSIDKNDGNGYSSFRNLYYERVGGSGVSGQFTFNVTDSTGIEIGDYVWGTGISAKTIVTNIVGNTITVDSTNIATVSGTIRFNHLPYETGVDPLLGLKMKWRIKTVTTNTVAITSLYIQTESTDLGRASQYPLDTVEVSVTGLKDNTEVRIYLSGTTTELSGIETATDGVSGNRTFTSTITSGVTVDIVIISLTYENERINAYTIPETNVSIPVQQRFDRNYNNPF